MQWVVEGRGGEGYGGLRKRTPHRDFESLGSKASPQDTLACIKNELFITWQNRDCDECTLIQPKYTHLIKCDVT